MKRCLLFFLVLMLTISPVIFTGCTNKVNIPDGPVSLPTSTRTYGYAENLFIWWEQTDADLTLLQDAWYDFREIYTQGNYPKYSKSINMFSMSGDADGTAQLEQQIMGGTAPDLIRMDHIYLAALGEAGFVLDLEQEFGATSQLKEQFVSATWEASCAGDAVYGIPFDASTVIFGAKTASLDIAGVVIPESFEALQDACTRIQKAELTQTPYTLPLNTGETDSLVDYFATWVWRLGGDILNEDKTEAIFNDTQTGVKALQMIMQLEEDGLLTTTAHEDGKTAMRDYGTWWMEQLTEDMAFSLQPQLKEGIPRYSNLGLYDLAIVSTGRETLKQLTYDFAVYLATEKGTVDKKHYVYTYCRNHNTIPALKAAITTSEIWNADSTEGEFWRISAQQLEIARSRLSEPCRAEIDQVLESALQEALQRKKSPQQALDDAAAITNRLLAEG